MKFRIICISLTGFFMIGCATLQLTEGGKSVNVVFKEEPKGKCKHVGDVELTQYQRVLSMETLKTTFRNKAAEQGANTVTVDTLEKDSNWYYGSGRSFSCN